MNTRDYQLNLWKEFMEQTQYITERDKETMGKIAAVAMKSPVPRWFYLSMK